MDAACAAGAVAFQVFPGWAPAGGNAYFHDTPRDIGPIAKQYPGISFVVEDAALCSGQATCASQQGPFDPSQAGYGTGQLIHAPRLFGVDPVAPRCPLP